MNLVYRCEQCGVDKPCIIVITNTGKFEEPFMCVDGRKADWKLMT
jgi:hypothetical protein